MIERRFKCEICEWESDSFQTGFLVSDPTQRDIEFSLLIHFQIKHPEAELKDHLTIIDGITGAYRSSIASMNSLAIGKDNKNE